MNYIQCDFLSLIRLGLGIGLYSSIKQTLNKSFILKKIRTNNVLVSFILNHIIFDKRSDRKYILIYFISGKFPHLSGKIERKTFRCTCTQYNSVHLRNISSSDRYCKIDRKSFPMYTVYYTPASIYN
jgi:hypothetical protein